MTPWDRIVTEWLTLRDRLAYKVHGTPHPVLWGASRHHNWQVGSPKDRTITNVRNILHRNGWS